LPHSNKDPVSCYIWLDSGTLRYLRDKTFEEGASVQEAQGASAQERDCVQHRAKGYYFMNNILRKRTSPNAGKIDRVVPPPNERVNLIRAVHIEVGHFGVHKTHSLLEPTYFWSGMFAQVRKEVSSCTVCDRVKANFKVKDPALKPLPIMEMFYRWGVDLCKMLFKSVSGNKYVVVMIEHFSKWIELVPIPDKTSHHTAAALRGVLCRYGAPAEVLTDQGEEFQGEFAELLIKLLIDHRLTSRDQPQSDGLAKRMVQTVKEALWKYVLMSDRHHWDVQLCWIAMGYRMSAKTLSQDIHLIFFSLADGPSLGRPSGKCMVRWWTLTTPRRGRGLSRRVPRCLNVKCQSLLTIRRLRNTGIPYGMPILALEIISQN
jgi:hypothetical protein